MKDALGLQLLPWLDNINVFRDHEFQRWPGIVESFVGMVREEEIRLLVSPDGTLPRFGRWVVSDRAG